MSSYLGKFTNVIRNLNGTVAPNSLVYVYNAGTGVLANLWRNDSGTIPLPNPIQADRLTGVLTFYVEPGLYDMVTPTGLIESLPIAPNQKSIQDIRNLMYNGLRTPDGGVETIPRLHCFSTTGCALATGSMRIVYFIANKSMSVNRVTTFTNATNATGSPTVQRKALFSVGSDYGLTDVLATTTHDSALWTVASTAYKKNLSATVDLVEGQLYAGGCLIVGGSQAPNLHGVSLSTSAINEVAPVISKRLNSITDLPSGATAIGSLGVGQYVPYMLFTYE